MKKKVLIFIISYNHENLLTEVLQRIPDELTTHPDADFEILIIEDCSQDETFKTGYEFLQDYKKLPTTILSNPVNQGFGGNQKLGYQYAIDNNFDHVVLLHGDGQYAPELIPELVAPLLKGEADAVFGSRMARPKDALAGGMPLYKWIGNKVLTRLENFLMGSNLSEWHSGYRLYSVEALKEIPFRYNSNYFDFDSQIIIQLLGLEKRITEIPIPTHYGDEDCNVDGIKYARKIILACLQFRAQDMGVFYHPRYYLPARHEKELSRSSFDSAVNTVSNAIKDAKGKVLVVVDQHRKEVRQVLKELPLEITFISPAEVSPEFGSDDKFELVVFMDTFESSNNIDEALVYLRNNRATSSARFIAVGANVGYVLVRLALLFGQMNYGVRGILDLRHRRLFTFASARNLVECNGYQLGTVKGIQVPWPLVFKNRLLLSVVTTFDKFALKLFKGLFAYQYYLEFTPLPTVKTLLERAESNTRDKVEKIKQDRVAQ